MIEARMIDSAVGVDRLGASWVHVRPVVPV